MKQELHVLESNKTWVLTHLPKGKKLFGCKWVSKVKYKHNGQAERYKARLIAKGYNQIEALGYKDSFSPIAKIVTIRISMVLATLKQRPIYQLDINNAFLHGFLNKEVYMSPPRAILRLTLAKYVFLKGLYMALNGL